MSGSSASFVAADPLVAPFLAALIEGRPAKVNAEVDHLSRSGYQVREIYLRVLAPALMRVGTLWEEGVISVADEHLATALVRAQMARLTPLPAIGRPINGRLVLAGVPGELHALGTRMVADFLEGDGWEVSNLGQNTPRDDLVRFVGLRRPDVVGLSCGLVDYLGETAGVVRALRSIPDAPTIIVGGAAFAGDPSSAAIICADLFAKDADEASSLLRQRFS